VLTVFYRANKNKATHEKENIAFAVSLRAAINQIKETRKYPTLTAFRSYSSELDEIANLVYGLHDTLFRQISAKQ